MRLSIGARLVLFATIAMLVLLPVAGWMIGGAFARSVEAAFDSRLDDAADALAGLIEVQPDRTVQMNRAPDELRFDQVYSGWYWQVREGDRVVHASRSLWDASLSYDIAPGEPRRRLELVGPRGEPLRATLLLLNLGRVAAPVELIFAGPRSEIDAEVRAFNRVLILALGSLGAMLVIVFALQIRWGLAPLRRMGRDLKRIREGEVHRVDPDLPPDLASVADTMNEVLAHQESLIERGRATAGNLAHALKTPLTTMRLRVDAAPVDLQGLKGDLAQVHGIVEHHLARAGAAGRAGAVFRRTDARAAIEPVLVAVRGLSKDRGIVIEAQYDGDAHVAMDAQDLQEVVGNLLDNAVKWARSKVVLSLRTTSDAVDVLVDDDGHGIPDVARAQAMARGTQLDEASSGSGLGLAIVRDIAALYRIAFELEASPQGGVRAHLRLPRAASGAPTFTISLDKHS